jgi:hypothetical protein
MHYGGVIHACRDFADDADIHSYGYSEQRFAVTGFGFALKRKWNREHKVIVRVIHDAAVADIALLAPARDKINAWLIHDGRTRLVPIGAPQLYAIQNSRMKTFCGREFVQELYHSPAVLL